MAGGGHADEPSGTPDPVEKGIATLGTIRIGVKAFVQKDGELRKAEILSIQTRKNLLHFYVHYVEFNKRLDEWIPASRIDLGQEVEWPAPEKPEKKKTANAPPKAPPKAASQKRPRQDSREISSTPDLLTTTSTNKARPPRPSQAGGKENREDGVEAGTPGIIPSLLPSESATATGTPREGDSEDVEMADTVPDAAADADNMKSDLPSTTNAEAEIEKLRFAGSMVQNHAQLHLVRNLSRIQMGKHEMEPWYFSPYPQEYTDADVVYIDEFCLSYFSSQRAFERHRAKCTLTHPPGNEIYRDDHVSFFEVDGRRQRTWCRNLCLLSKLFLDHKTLYYDVDPFLFYCMATRDEHGCHLVGYFSKEKESAEGYNVACILTLPQFQRKGYGRLIIAFSYELSKREGKLGSPEKPLSDLGMLGYRQYWRETLMDLLLEEEKKESSISELAAMSSMTEKDVQEQLEVLQVLRYQKGAWIVVITDALIEQRDKQIEKEKVKGKRRIDPTRLSWKPPVFTAGSRTWAW